MGSISLFDMNQAGQIIFSPASPLRTFCAARMAISSLVLMVAEPKCGTRTWIGKIIFFICNKQEMLQRYKG